MASSTYTSRDEFESGYKTLESTFASGRTKSIKWRKVSARLVGQSWLIFSRYYIHRELIDIWQWQLKQVWWMFEQNTDRVVDALHADLNRHAFETVTMEVRAIKGDVIDMLEHIDEWSEGERPDAGFIFGTLGKAWVRKEPLGQCFPLVQKSPYVGLC